MNPKKILIFIFGFLFLLFLIVKTFFSPYVTYSDELKFGDTYVGYRTYDFSSDNEIKVNNVEDTNKNVLFSDVLISNQFNLLDTVYYYGKEYSLLKIKEEGNKITLNLKKGLYFIDLNNLGYEYTIKTNGFRILPKSAGKIFIDSRNDNKVIFFSLDGVYDINLFDEKKGEIVTNMFLYPHMYLIGNTSRIKFLRNAALSRLSTIFKIGYNNNDLITNGAVNLDFIKGIGSIKNDSKRNNFLFNILNLLYSDYKLSFKLYSNLEQIDIGNVSGLDYIKKYFNLFQNNEKKKIYYKNLLLKEIHSLFLGNGKQVDTINQIIEDLDVLKKLSESDYNDILDIINKYYLVISDNNDISKFNIKENFAKLLNKINKNSIKNYKSYIYLNSLFYTYNINSTNLNYKILLGEFINLYFKDLGLSRKINHENQVEFLELNKKYLSKKNDIIINLNYVSFLLFNIIKTDFDLHGEIESINNLLNIYILINEYLINNSGNNIKITFLYNYKDILDIFIVNFYDAFFEKERNDKGLLIRKDFSGDTKNTQQILNYIKYFLDYINSNKSLLDYNLNRNRLLLEENDNRLKLFNELNLAYIDYEQYKIDYDQGKFNLIETDSIGTVKDFSLSIDKALDYLNYFNGLYLNNIKIDIIDGYYYSLSNILLDKKYFSFDLYPDEANKISNIYLSDSNGDLKPIKFSYNLDYIQEEWEVKYKEADGIEEKEEYNFKNFFINTFIKTQKNKNVDYFDDNIIENEDKGIVILKKDKLLGSEGDFINVNKILNIKYNNINVTDINGNYKIKIKDGVLKIKDSFSDYPLLYDFYSDYIFNKSNHSFKNIKIRPYRVIEGNNIEKIYILGENTFISILGSIDVLDFTNFMKSSSKELSLLNKVAKIVGVDDQKLVFYAKIHKISSSFNFNGSDFKIILSKDGIITSFKQNGQLKTEYTGKRYIELKKILNNI